MNDNTFWVNDPTVLFKNCNIIPTAEMTNSANLNALTRLLILVSVGMYFMGSSQYLTVFTAGLLMILLMYTSRQQEHFNPETSEKAALEQGIRSFDPNYDSKPHVKNPVTDACWFNQDQDLLNAAYEITPNIQFNHDESAKRSYMNAKYELELLQEAEGFTQIWRSEPGMNGSYSMVPDPLTQFPVYEEDSQGQDNYIVRSIVDHLPISQAQNGLMSIKPMAEAAYTQASLDFRTSIMNEHIDRFRRERQHNCPDMKLSAGTAGAGGSI